VSSSAPDPVERDSRGILDPWLLRQRVRLTRYPPPLALCGLVDRLWAVSWDLPPGMVHRQRVLTHPGANLSVGNGDGRSAGPSGRAAPVEARLNGVARGVTTRTLVGRGWAVAAMTRPGGLGAFIAGSAADFTDQVVPLGQAIGCDEPAVLRAMVTESDEASRAQLLALVLEQAADPDKVHAARQVAGVARLAETDRSIRRLSELSERSGIGQRTLQRLFLHYAGVPPTWVLRRYRLLEVAEAVRGGETVAWAQVAADLGYADQAHLISDFRAATGETPAAYAAAQGPRGLSAQAGLPGAPGAAGSLGSGCRTRNIDQAGAAGSSGRPVNSSSRL
jgi:AraC-like DNA-binding protein